MLFPHYPSENIDKNLYTLQRYSQLALKNQLGAIWVSYSHNGVYQEFFFSFNSSVVSSHLVLLSASVNHSVMSSSLQYHGLEVSRFFCPWNSPGKNTGVGCHSLLQGIFMTQG